MAETIPALYAGSLACVREGLADPKYDGIVFEITKENPKNWKMTPINGDGVPISCSPSLLRAATQQEIESARAAAADRRPPLYPGQVVTAAGAGWREAPDILWVVTKVNPDGAAALAKFGGDGNRVYRPVPRALLNPLAPERIAAMAAAAALTTPPTAAARPSSPNRARS